MKRIKPPPPTAADMKRIADFVELCHPEPLNTELVRFLNKTEMGWWCIQHPLVYSIFHHDAFNCMVNESLRYKKRAVRRALAERDWSSYVWLHERPYRANALWKIRNKMDDQTYWSLLGRAWIDSENIRQFPHLWYKMLESERPDRWAIMDDLERQALAEMDEWITVWQGHTTERDDGWSWTTSHETAEWFANRFAHLEDSEPVVTSGVVRQRDVIAYFSRRNESEILVPRQKVKTI